VGNPAFRDATACSYPLIGGVNDSRNFVIGQYSRRQAFAPAGDLGVFSHDSYYPEKVCSKD
jgi:hypothetical protein